MIALAIIAGIFVLITLGLWAIIFFFVLEEAYEKWSWPKVLVVSTILAITILLIGRYFGF
jgi:uncharacterized membrane protein YpjA